MRKLLLTLFVTIVCYGQTAVTGSFNTPDGAPFTGTVTIQLVRPTVTNTCSTPAQVVSFAPVTVPVVGGSFSTLLYGSNCLSNGVSRAASALPLLGAGVGGTAAATGNWYGTLTVIAGTSPAANSAVAKIALTVPNLLTCYMVAVGANAITVNATLTQTTVARQSQTSVGRYLTIVSSTALTASQTYTWNYSCIQPYAVTVTDAMNRMQYQAQWAVAVSGPVDATLVDLSEIQKVQ